MIAENFVIASVGRRILGGIIDLILLFIFSLLFGYLTGLATTTTSGISLGWKATLLAAGICFFLFAVMEYFTGKTPGKYCAKTRVISEDGKKISFAQALIRNLTRFIDGIGFYIFGLIIILFDKNKQRLGDLMAKTYVINA